jgi:hypothetical protein
MGDGPEVAGQFVAVHADAAIGDREGAGLLVGGNVDFEGGSGVEDVFFHPFQVTQLAEGVRGIGNQLADENLAVGVERMHDDVEQLADFGLEGVGSVGGRGGVVGHRSVVGFSGDRDFSHLSSNGKGGQKSRPRGENRAEFSKHAGFFLHRSRICRRYPPARAARNYPIRIPQPWTSYPRPLPSLPPR